MKEEILILQENDLELVVSKKTLGSLTTNAMQIREMVRSALPMYDISNYNEDNIEQAKKDKATLNKAAKTLNQKRIDIEKEFTKPFAEFKEVVNETVKLISECSTKIDDVVKRNEQIYKDDKKKVILDYFNERNVNQVGFDKIFKSEWLNKTAREKVVFAEIDAILLKIGEDLKALEAMPEDADVLKTFYLDSLNISNTIQYANRLREQREKATKAEAERKRLEDMKGTEQAGVSFCSESVSAMPDNPISETLAAPETPIVPELLTRAFKVTGTREDIIALGDFMNARGIKFEKIEHVS